MFTVEMDTDGGESITVTTLDGSGRHDDVRLVMFDDVVFLSQHDDHDMLHSLIVSPQQLFDLVSSMSLPAGAYQVSKERGYTE
jgi:hypothetical protein|tara:strand:+ start:125 stop:373 length:249 start_codon:yes stop_codon:yes gene_type:complete